MPTTDFEKTFFAAIRDFAFYDELDAVCMKNEGRGIDGLWHPANIKGCGEHASSGRFELRPVA